MKYSQYSLSFYLLVSSLLWITACGGKKVAFTHVPAEATFASVINMEQLSSKAVEWKDLLELNLIFQKEFGADESNMILALLGSGINLNKNAYVFGKLGAKANNEYWAITAALKDTAQFAKMALEYFAPRAQLHPSIGSASTCYVQPQSVVGWNDERVLFLYTGKKTASSVLLERWRSLFELPRDQSMENQYPAFENLLRQQYDVALWTNYQEISRFHQKNSSSSLARVPNSLQGLNRILDFFTARIHFEQGRVVNDFQLIYNQQEVNHYEQLFRNEVDEELLHQLPIAQPDAFVSLGIGMSGLQQMLDEAGWLEFPKKVIGLFGLTMEEVFDLITGDFVLAVEEIHPEAPLNTDMLIALRMKNRAKLDGLLDKVAGLFFLKKMKDHYASHSEFGDFYLIERENVMYIALNKHMRDQVLKNKEQLDDRFTHLNQGKISLLYLDCNKIAPLLENVDVALDGQTLAFKDQILPLLDTFTLTLNPMDRKRILSEGRAIMHLKEKDRNALVILIELIQQIQQEQVSS